MSTRSRSTARGGAFLAALAMLAMLLSMGARADAVTLTAPTGLVPAGATVTDNPTLTWTRVTGATVYSVQVSTVSDFSTLLWSAKSVNKAAVPPVALPAGTLYWRVRAEAGATLGPWAGSTFVRSALTVPTGLAPADGATFTQPSQAPVVSWTGVTGAVSYSVQVASDSGFTTAVRTYTTKSLSVVVTNLSAGKPYYWRVRAAYSTTLNSDWSPTRSFVLGLLSKPTKNAPANGATIDDVVLDWNAVVGAVSYELQVATDPTMATGVTVDLKGLVGTNYSPPTGLANRTWYWRVRPVDYLGNKPDWSLMDIWNFNRGWTLQPTLEVPANGATVGDPFFYQWTPIKLADKYTLQLANASDFASNHIVDTCTTVYTTYVPTGLGDCMPDAEGTYWWRIIGNDGPGPSGGTGALTTNAASAQVYSFTYKNARPAMTSPATGASVSVPTLKWAAVSGAAKYKVTITDTTTSDASSYFTTGTSFTVRNSLELGTTYRWQVQAVSVSGREGSPYTTGEQPTFTMVAPAAATASTPEPTTAAASYYRFPTLTWTPVVNATSYDLQVRLSGTTTWTPLVDSFVYPAGEDDTVDWLVPGTYQWRAVAFNGNTQLSVSSTLGQFTISDLAAVAGYRAGHTGTAVGSTGTSCGLTLPSTCANLRQTPVLSWTADANAAFYRVTLAKDAAMTQLVAGYPKAVETTRFVPVAALADNTGSGSYFWAVQACRASNKCNTVSSAPAAFTKVSKPVQLVTPTADQVVTANEITLVWRDWLATNQDTAAFPVADPTGVQTVAPRAEAKQYKIQVAADSSFVTMYDNTTVDQTQYTTSANTYPDGKLYWRVQAIDGSGNVSPWSAVQAFTKRTPFVTPTSPLNGVSVPGTVPFTWTAAPYAASYDVEVYKNGDTTGASTNRVILTHSKVPYFAPSTPLPVATTAYVWRIRPVDAKGRAGRWTSLTDPAAQFFVVGSGPSLTSPAGGVYIPTNEGLFTWSTVAGAASYKFERRLVGATAVTQSLTTVATAFAPTAKISSGHWEWRVSALDTAGKVLGTSSWRRFWVDATAPKVVSYTPTGTVSATANFKVTFNEEVMNVNTSTITITASGGTNPLATSVSLDATNTVATLNPSSALVSGKKYVIRVTNGVTDLQGNAVTAMSWTITAK